MTPTIPQWCFILGKLAVKLGRLVGLRLSITTKAKFASGKTYKSHNKEMWASTEGVAGLSLRPACTET